MRVLQLISSGGQYGAEKVLLGLAQGLKEQGHQVVVGIFHNLHAPHLEVAVCARGLCLTVEIVECRGRCDQRAINFVRDLIRRYGVDVVHSHGYKADFYGYRAAKREGVPIVATCHSWSDRMHSLRFYRFLDRLILRRFNHVVAVSAGVAASLSRCGVALQKISVIGNGIDVNQFAGAKPKLRDEMRCGDRPVVGFVGRLILSKGISFLFQAAQDVLRVLPDVLFVLVGDGPDREKLEEMADALGIKGSVVFAGYRSDMPAVFASFDVVVLPSLDEGMPLAIIEAMAAGKPTIATRVGAIPSIVVPGQTGTLVEPRDGQGLGRAILGILSNMEWGRELGQNGQRRVRDCFSVEQMIEEYSSVYSRLVSSRHVPEVSLSNAPSQTGDLLKEREGKGSHSNREAARRLTSSITTPRPSIKGPMTVLVLDLCAMVPYYNSYLCKSLREQNIDVLVGSTTYQSDRQSLSRHGLKRAAGLLDVVGHLSIHNGAVRRALKFLEICCNLLILTIRCAVSKPNVIHVQYLLLLEKGLLLEVWFLRLAKWMGVPLVYTVHNVLPHHQGELRREAYSRVYRMADALIAHTQESKGRLVQEFCVEPDRIAVIPHGPLFHDGSRLAVSEARERIGMSKDECVVLWQGNIKPYKGLDLLLDAWARVQASPLRARLVIAGTGEAHLVEAVEKMVLRLGIQDTVKLELRFIPSDEIPCFYQAADLLVYPYREITQSGALLTGLSFGKAIIASALPAFQEFLINGENALLFRCGDVESLARSLTHLIQCPADRARLARAAALMSDTQTAWTQIARRTIQCYQAVLQSRLLLPTRSTSQLRESVAFGTVRAKPDSEPFENEAGK